MQPDRLTAVLLISTSIISFIIGFLSARKLYKNDNVQEKLIRLSLTQLFGIGLFIWYAGFTKSPESVVSMMLLAVGLGGATGELFASILNRSIGEKA